MIWELKWKVQVFVKTLRNFKSSLDLQLIPASLSRVIHDPGDFSTNTWTNMNAKIKYSVDNVNASSSWKQ